MPGQRFPEWPCTTPGPRSGLERAERILRAELEPAAGVILHWTRAELERTRGRAERVLDAFQAAARLAGLLLTRAWT